MPNYLNDLNAAIAAAQTETDTEPPAVASFIATYYEGKTEQEYTTDVEERLAGQGQFCALVCGAALVWCRHTHPSNPGGVMCQAQYNTCIGNCQ